MNFTHDWILKGGAMKELQGLGLCGLQFVIYRSASLNEPLEIGTGTDTSLSHAYTFDSYVNGRKCLCLYQDISFTMRLSHSFCNMIRDHSAHIPASIKSLLTDSMLQLSKLMQLKFLGKVLLFFFFIYVVVMSRTELNNISRT